MGVKDLWKLLEKKGYKPPTLHLPHEHTGVLRVDLQACLYSVLQRASDKPTEVSTKKVDDALSEIMDKANTVIYVDGQDTEEKQATSDDRKAKRQKAKAKAAAALDKLEGILDQYKLPGKQLHIEIKKSIGGAFHLSQHDRLQLADYLKQQDWTVKVATTEADVEIAKDCGPQDVVLTKDSDALIYNNISTVWRLVGKEKVQCYNMEDVCSDLKLDSKAHLTALGVVSTNDYQHNIPTLGSATNLGILREIPGDGKQLTRNPLLFSSLSSLPITNGSL
jgi:5'-3' exonuclease